MVVVELGCMDLIFLQLVILTLIGTIGNSSYYVYDDTTTWTEANNLCINAGGNLVSINF